MLLMASVRVSDTFMPGCADHRLPPSDSQPGNASAALQLQTQRKRVWEAGQVF